MKKATLDKIKANGFDYALKGLAVIVFWLVKDMHSDIKFLMKTISVHEVRLSNLESSTLINRFKAMRIPMKDEEMITYDTLTQKQN